MSRRPRSASFVRRPKPHNDRPATAKLVYLGVACFAVGWGVAMAMPIRGSGDPGQRVPVAGPRPEIATRGAVSASAMPPTSAEPASGRTIAATEPEARPEPRPSPAAPARSTAATEPAARPEPRPSPAAPARSPEPPASAQDPGKTSPASPTPARGPLRFRRGRVVYLQCEGLEADSAQPRCPRDVALEREAWPKLRTLAECSTGSIGDGFVNVQLEFRDGQPEPQVQVFDWTGASRPGIDPGVAHACLRHELRTLRTSLGAAKLVVSFRYGVLRGIAPAER